MNISFMSTRNAALKNLFNFVSVIFHVMGLSCTAHTLQIEQDVA